MPRMAQKILKKNISVNGGREGGRWLGYVVGLLDGGDAPCQTCLDGKGGCPRKVYQCTFMYSIKIKMDSFSHVFFWHAYSFFPPLVCEVTERRRADESAATAAAAFVVAACLSQLGATAARDNAALDDAQTIDASCGTSTTM